MAVIIILAILFGSLASLMAFLVTYGEYERHNFPKGRLIRESLRAALVSFVFLFGLTVIAGYLFLKFGG